MLLFSIKGRPKGGLFVFWNDEHAVFLKMVVPADEHFFCLFGA